MTIWVCCCVEPRDKFDLRASHKAWVQPSYADVADVDFMSEGLRFQSIQQPQAVNQ